jgi:hypothetical protein
MSSRYIRTPLARSSSRLGHGPLKAGARVRVPYALPYDVSIYLRVAYIANFSEVECFMVTRHGNRSSERLSRALLGRLSRIYGFAPKGLTKIIYGMSAMSPVGDVVQIQNALGQ